MAQRRTRLSVWYKGRGPNPWKAPAGARRYPWTRKKWVERRAGRPARYANERVKEFGRENWNADPNPDMEGTREGVTAFTTFTRNPRYIPQWNHVGKPVGSLSKSKWRSGDYWKKVARKNTTINARGFKTLSGRKDTSSWHKNKDYGSARMIPHYGSNYYSEGREAEPEPEEPWQRYPNPGPHGGNDEDGGLGGVS